jgi:hypothetical protein
MEASASRAQSLLRVHYGQWLRYGDSADRYRAKALVWVVCGEQSPYRTLR